MGLTIIDKMIDESIKMSRKFASLKTNTVSCEKLMGEVIVDDVAVGLDDG